MLARLEELCHGRAMSKAAANPLILTIIGITGDLASRKIIPALWHLFITQELPERVRIIGLGRRRWTDRDLHHLVTELFQEQRAHPSLSAFLNLFAYVQGEFTTTSRYDTLATAIEKIEGEWQMPANRLFCLAMPPQLISSVFDSLGRTGLHQGGQATWTRLMIEKPFGSDQASAEQLEKQLHALFTEEQLYRVDHYLGKENLNQLIRLATSQSTVWNKESITKIEIKILETLDVANRAEFYDSVGALRDVLQNHAIELLAVTLAGTMEPGKRNKILATLLPPEKSAVDKQTRRAQYSGYQQHSGLLPDSKTETYAKITLASYAPAWQGVPLVLETGKNMAENQKEITLSFRSPSDNSATRNRTINLDDTPPTPPYARIFTACIDGDKTFFVTGEEIITAWRLIDPIRHAWDNGTPPLQSYTPGSNPSN